SVFERARDFFHNSGAMRRENAMLRLGVIACGKRVALAQGSPCDEAINPSVMPRDGLLRFARNDGQAMTTLLRRLSGLAEHPCRRRETARRAVRHFDLILPRKAKRTGDHVLHEGVGAIHRAAFHRDVAAVPELVDVVLDAPVDPRLA